MDFIAVVVYLSVFSILIPFALAFLQWNRLPTRWSAIRWLIIVSFLGDFASYIFALTLGSPEIIGNLYLVIQFALIFYLFRNYIRYKRMLIVVYGVYLGYYIVNIMFFENFFIFLTNANALGGLMIILLILFFFYQHVNEANDTDTQRKPMVLIAIAFLLYYGGSFFVFLSDSYLQEQLNDMIVPLWTIHNFCNILKNVLIAIALWLNYKTLKSSVSI